MELQAYGIHLVGEEGSARDEGDLDTAVPSLVVGGRQRIGVALHFHTLDFPPPALMTDLACLCPPPTHTPGLH